MKLYIFFTSRPHAEVPLTVGFFVILESSLKKRRQVHVAAK